MFSHFVTFVSYSVMFEFDTTIKTFTTRPNPKFVGLQKDFSFLCQVVDKVEESHEKPEHCGSPALK